MEAYTRGGLKGLTWRSHMEAYTRGGLKGLTWRSHMEAYTRGGLKGLTWRSHMEAYTRGGLKGLAWRSHMEAYTRGGLKAHVHIPTNQNQNLIRRFVKILIEPSYQAKKKPSTTDGNPENGSVTHKVSRVLKVSQTSLIRATQTQCFFNPYASQSEQTSW